MNIPILSVSPFLMDHESLQEIMHGWKIHQALNLANCKRLMRDHQFDLIVCERDLSPGNWKDLFAETSSLPKPPCVIVTSLHADDHLWVEALNLGAFDVLAKPFNREEVIRTIRMAALKLEHQTPKPRFKPLARAAGS